MKISDVRPQIVYMVGLPGVGKTTFAKSMFPKHIHISNDKVTENFAVLHGLTYDEAWGKLPFSEVIRFCQSDFESATKNWQNIVIDNTNLHPGSRRIYRHPLYDTIAVVVNIPESLRKERCKSREGSGKSIPEETIKQMKAKYVEPTVEEGFSEIIYVGTKLRSWS